jgi:3-hydroxyacyl-CoA dehydrogenase
MGHQGNDIRITLIGAGTIGLSFAAFHLSHLSSPSQLTIFDTRPDLEEYVRSTLPKFFPDAPISYVTLSNSLPDAVRNASIIQESGPENLAFKKSIWAEVEKHAPQDTLLWSSTSGIPASQQIADMQDKTRLLVVRKLISISPSSAYSQAIQGSSVQSTAHNAITRTCTIPTDIR